MLILLLLLAQLLPPPSRAGDVAPAPDYETALTALLQQVVTAEGLVDYGRLRGPLNADFRRVLKAVETFDAAALQRSEARMAFWMNAYNVQMLQNIIETPGIGDLLAEGHGDAFFKTPYLTAGLGLSLDAMEHEILRLQSDAPAHVALQPAALDPRIHVGLNCAAISCPRIRRRAFTAKNLFAELEAAMRDFVNSPTHLRVEGDTFVLSALLDWFAADFDHHGPGGAFLLRYLDATRPDADALRQLLSDRTLASLKERADVRYAYQWTVNKAP